MPEKRVGTGLDEQSLWLAGIIILASIGLAIDGWLHERKEARNAGRRKKQKKARKSSPQADERDFEG